MTVDLRTRYLGLELRSPIVASASPLNGEPVTAGLVERAGAAAIVLPSLFEEEILHEEIELNRSLEQGTEHFAEALDYFPDMTAFAGAGDRYVSRLERIKQAQAAGQRRPSSAVPPAAAGGAAEPVPDMEMPSAIRMIAPAYNK